VKKHGEAIGSNKVTVAKMCDWGVERIDRVCIFHCNENVLWLWQQATAEIKALERCYTDAQIERNEDLAIMYRKRMQDEKDAAIHEIHVDLIFQTDTSVKEQEAVL
jgi:hypothetical protein